MSSPAVGIEATATIHEADELMLHFGLKAVPVFMPDTRQCIGLLDALTASRASALPRPGAFTVEDYMTCGRITTLSPDATLKDSTTTIVGGRQRLARRHYRRCHAHRPYQCFCAGSRAICRSHAPPAARSATSASSYRTDRPLCQPQHAAPGGQTGQGIWPAGLWWAALKCDLPPTAQTRILIWWKATA